MALHDQVHCDCRQVSYEAVFDPLDGSRNIDAGIPTGTIFGIYRASGACTLPSSSTLQCFLQAPLKPMARLQNAELTAHFEVRGLCRGRQRFAMPATGEASHSCRLCTVLLSNDAGPIMG